MGYTNPATNNTKNYLVIHEKNLLARGIIHDFLCTQLFTQWNLSLLSQANTCFSSLLGKTAFLL